MFYFQRMLLVTALICGILCSNYSTAEITVEPFGFTVSLEEDEGTEIELMLTNTGDETVMYVISLSEPDQDGVRRDPDPWELLESWELEEIVEDDMLQGVVFADDRFYVSGGNNGDEPNKIYMLDRRNGELIGWFEQFVDDRYGMRDLAYDGELIWGGVDRALYGFTPDGDLEISFEVDADFEGRSIAWDPDREALWSCDISSDIYAINRDGEVVETIEGNGELRIYGLAYWSDDPDSYQLYIFCRGQDNEGIAVFKMNLENGEYSHVVDLDVEGRPSGIQITDQYDNQNWTLIGLVQNYDCLNIWQLAEAGDWILIEPNEGIIEADNSSTVDIMISPDGIEEGVYEKRILIELSDPYQPQIEISAVISIGTPTYNLSGVVTDAANNDIITGAAIEMNPYFITKFTDDEGIYDFTDIPSDEYELSVTATDFLPAVRAIEINEENVELNIALLHSECAPSMNRFYRMLELDTQHEIEFTVDNIGNGPLTYQVKRRLDAYNAEPYELRFSYELEDTTGDDFLEGVVYIDGYFYISGGNNGEDVNKIYVLNRDGELVREFDQFAESRYGMRDLVYDGELIWGADGGTFYGFTTDGDSITSFDCPVDNFEGRAIAWDPINELLLVSDISTDIIAFNREGELIETYERPEELRIYGLGYWFDDPDGYNLYAFCRGPDDVGIDVFKIDLESGEYMLAGYLDTEGRPAGFQITNQLDVYSWVFVALVQNPDRLNIWQLGDRKEWFQVEPTEGVIESDDSEDFILTLDATGLVPHESYEGELVYIHDGIGGETVIPIAIDIIGVPPPPQFNLSEPENGDTLYTGEVTTFTWENIDPWEMIDESYLLWIRSYSTNDSISTTLSDTFVQVSLDSSIFNIGLDQVYFQWWVCAVSGDDSIECNDRFNFYLHGGAGIYDQESDLPREFAIQSAYPNPFNSQMRVTYSLLKTGIVGLGIYDLNGHLISELMSDRQSAGIHTIMFDGSDIPSGVYMLLLKSGDQSSMMKVILVK
ncbi:T9SS type A sorting domain-containing protein [bacterium]|nr:T9SS type A sorting domain-containing protein [bacterium]